MEKKDSIKDTKSFAKGSIFSTQDLTVHTENLPPQITDAEESAGRDNQARISPVFGQTDETHGMNNVAFPRPGRFQGGVTEDITLPHTARKRNKLPIFVLIILVLAAAGFGIFALLRGVGGDGATSVASLEEAQKAFARYATYLLYGEEREELTGEFEVGKTYELDRQLSDKNPDSEYWRKAGELLDTAITGYEGLEEKSERITEELGVEREYFSLFNADRQIYLTDNEIATGIATHGENWVKDNMQSKYDAWSEFSTETGTEFVQNAMARYSAQVALIAQFIDGGCLINNSLDTDCTFELQQTNNNRALSDAIDLNKQTQEVLGSIRRRLRNGFLNQTWLINLQMSEKQESQDGGVE